jgi:hypothetical protein
LWTRDNVSPPAETAIALTRLSETLARWAIKA